jgi:ectoine hydroxylase
MGSLTLGQIESFHRDGYLFVRPLLDREETAMLLDAAKSDSGVLEHSYARTDSAGRQSKLAVWNHPGDDIYGAIARSRRIVDAMEQLLGGEVYHWHSKMMLKEPRVGGAWEWHQDYGYWYNDGCLLPDMASCLIAVDRATRANGCLQVLRGSHTMGRIDHGKSGDQTGADLERVDEAKKRFELVYCELEPGDAILFHGNLLHASAPNESEMPRWSLICCYNLAANSPYKASKHPAYTPLQKLPDSAVKEAGARRSPAAQGFLGAR